MLEFGGLPTSSLLRYQRRSSSHMVSSFSVISSANSFDRSITLLAMSWSYTSILQFSLKTIFRVFLFFLMSECQYSKAWKEVLRAIELLVLISLGGLSLGFFISVNNFLINPSMFPPSSTLGKTIRSLPRSHFRHSICCLRNPNQLCSEMLFSGCSISINGLRSKVHFDNKSR
jgi:hypothetical protein